MFLKKMNLPAEISKASYSKEELILPYIKAMDLLEFIKDKEIHIKAWEGRILYPNNTLEQSKVHKGSETISKLPHASAISLAHSTIMQAHEMWETKPEVDNGELLYCLTIST